VGCALEPPPGLQGQANLIEGYHTGCSTASWSITSSRRTSQRLWLCSRLSVAMRHSIIEAFIVEGAPIVRELSWTPDEASAPRKRRVHHHTRENLRACKCRAYMHTHAACSSAGNIPPALLCQRREARRAGDVSQQIMCTNLGWCDFAHLTLTCWHGGRYESQSSYRRPSRRSAGDR
jgi:hypothetical protein